MLFENSREAVRSFYDMAKLSVKDKLSELSSTLKIESGRANALSPLSVLTRGYSVVSGEGGVVKSVSSVSTGDVVSIRLCDGEAKAEILGVKEN